MLLTKQLGKALEASEQSRLSLSAQVKKLTADHGLRKQPQVSDRDT